MICQSCQTFAPTFQKANECCQIRLLMESPKHQRLAVYARIRKEDGSRAVEEMKEVVRKEYKRKMEWKENIVRSRKSNGQINETA
jgi:hypothetical protein